MIKRHSDYLASIGMIENAYLARVDALLNRLAIVFPERISDILVEDVIQEDGVRQYLHFGAFSSNYIGSVANFLTDDNVGLDYLAGGVAYVRISTASCDLIKATPESRINVQFSLMNQPGLPGGWSLQGSGTNCDHIWNMTTKHVRPRLEII